MYAVRMKVNLVFVKICFVLFSLAESNELNDKTCPRRVDEDVIWPEAEDGCCVNSDPFCISKQMETIKRCCSEDGEWGNCPACYSVQQTINNPCPDDLKNDVSKNLCILVIENSKYPPQCPYEESVSFSEYVSSVDAAYLPIWMPVVRSTGKYGIGLLQWVEATSDYGTVYNPSCEEDSCSILGAIKGKNCLIYYSSSMIETVSCDEEHTAICAYKSLPNRDRSFCSQSFPLDTCMQSDYSTKSKCFCKKSTDTAASPVTKAQFLQPYQNLLYPFLSDETCYIGLERDSEGCYIWSSANVIISYTHWADSATFGDDYKYGVISRDGWTLAKSEDELPCMLYELRPSMEENEIILNYDQDNNKFTVELTSPNNCVFKKDESDPMVFCFTDAARDTLISRIEISKLSSAFYEFPPHEDGPGGTYWCEAFAYPNVIAKRSNEFLLRYTDQFVEEYAVILTTKYDQGSLLTQESLKYYQKSLADQIAALEEISVFYPRIYKVIDIDEESSEISLNFHLINRQSSEPLATYSALRRNMEQNLKEFVFINVFGVDCCVGIQTGNYGQPATWPVTYINEVASRPREGFCIKSDGSIMYRHCVGNYIDGAQWSELQEDCTIQQSTNITVNLTNIISLNKSEAYAQQVADIIMHNSQDLVPLDIHLVSVFLGQIVVSDEINMNVTGRIISTLMDVPPNVLQKSQMLFNATDRVLYYTDRIIANSKFMGGLVIRNFMMFSSYIKDSFYNAVAIISTAEHDYDIYTYSMLSDSDLETVKQVENLKAAIVFSASVTTQLSNVNASDESLYIVTVYRNPNLFNKQYSSIITTRLIFGVVFPNFKGDLSGDIYTIYSKSDIDHNFSCSYWDYDLNKTKGYWESASEVYSDDSSIVCRYDHIAHFALTEKKEINITHELENILLSDDSLQDKLESASSLITNYYMKFQPADVLLISKILYEVVLAEGDNLELVADIVDKIIEVPAEVLQRSQLMYNATGKILIYFDQILQQSASSHFIQRNNFYAIVQFLKDESIYGFTVSNCEESCDFALLHEPTSDTKISLIENLDTALLINEDLLKQLLDLDSDNYTPKIVVTVFFTDAIFIEDYSSTEIITKVVGVSLPNFDLALNGGIDLLYSVNLSYVSNYTCSVYSINDDESTSQKGFWNSENPPKQIKDFLECEFWLPKYYALVHSLINFTYSLENLFNSKESVEFILNKALLILNGYHDYLKSVDVYIIAQLLSKVEVVDENILELCVRIVNNAMYISRDVLQAAQKMFGATDKILYFFKKIVAKYANTKEIYKENIALIISLLSETGMYGLAVENCASECEIVLLNKVTPEMEELNLRDAILMINPNFITKLLDAENENYIAKVVLIVFYNDALFNAETPLRNTSKIFGVYFPDYSQPFSNEVKLSFNPTNDKTDGYMCASWYNSREQNLYVVMGRWTYDSKARNDDLLSCNFYSNGFFTLVEGYYTYESITNTLDTVIKSDVSLSEKLYRVEDVSYYYTQFQPIDLYLLSGIFSQNDELNDDSLDRVSIIINNILQVPEETLAEARDQYNALKLILHGINDFASRGTSRQFSLIKDQFGLVICQLHTSTNNGVVVTKSSVSCILEIEQLDDFARTENDIAGLMLTEEVKDQIVSGDDAPKIIVTVFLNDVFFKDKEYRKPSNTAAILGVSIPNFDEQLKGEIVALFNNGIYNKSNYHCAYWDFNSSSLWNIESNKGTVDLFTQCNFKEATYLTLIETSKTETGSTNVTAILEQILEGDFTASEKLTQTESVVSLYTEKFKDVDVFYVATILSCVEDVTLQDLKATADIINNIMKISRKILVDSQVKYNATDWILYHVDRIAEKFDNVAKIETKNLAIIVTEDIKGITIENCNVSCDVNVLRGDVNLTSISNNENLNTALILDEDLQSQIEDGYATTKIVVTVYLTDALFNEGYNVTYKNVGHIIGIVSPLIQEINGSLKFYYYTEDNSTGVCAFWNYTMSKDEILRGHWERSEKQFSSSRISLCEGTQSTHFALLETEKNVTSDLENILNSNFTVSEKLEMVVTITKEIPDELLPVDVYLISQILENATNESNTEDMVLTSHIISGLFSVPRHVLRKSQLDYCATDKILHAIDEMAKLIEETDGEPIVQENFVIAVYDLTDTNTSGLVLEYCGDTRCNVSALKNNVNLTELALNENLETAVALSNSLLYQIQENEGPLKLVVTIFFNDALFNEEKRRHCNVSIICGVLITGLEESFEGSVYLMFNTPHNAASNTSCAFWDYQVNGDNETTRGSWRKDAEPQNKEHFTVCEFDHITHFALLLAGDNSSFPHNSKVLDIITNVNCLLSLIGVLGILLTAALFGRWRKNTGNQILLNFSIAISIKIVMLYVSDEVYEAHTTGVMCSITGAILHYAMLSEFCWMLIIAILQFKRFVEVLGGPPKYVLLKACICGWAFPLLPVVLILTIDTNNYNEGKVGLCYPSGLGLYLGIWLPLIVIILINFVIFIFIMYNVFHKKTEARDLVNHEILFQWRLALLLFFMLGLTWLFGFLSQIHGAEAFVYLFVFTSTLQGFVMFLFFIVFNKSTRFLYSQSIKLWLYSKGYKMQ